MTNAERLRELLAKTADLERPMLASHALLTWEDAIHAIQRGEFLLISRERVESILSELEGRG